MDAGELLQYGPTAEVFHAPQSLRVARAFSDPPMNLLAGTAADSGVELTSGPLLRIALPASVGGAVNGAVTVGLRSSALNVNAGEGDIALPGKVELAEISGSDTFVHVETALCELVAQLTGVHRFDLGAPITLYFSAAHAYVFDAAGQLAVAPAWRKAS
ncbi:hypothetical protein BH11PSE13_BH11PSE13_26910 [soil metagenome]